MSSVLRGGEHAPVEHPYRAGHPVGHSNGEVLSALRIAIPVGALLWVILIGLGYLIWRIV
jgi:hypothetical protein